MLIIWIGFVVLIVGLLALDLGVLHKKSEEMGTATAIRWTIAWIGVGVSFGAIVYFVYEYHWFGAGVERDLGGLAAMSQYFTAYVLEKSLSVDNIFVISMIFTSLNIPAAYQRRVLFWGIFGALVMRSIMILGGVWLVDSFAFTFYLFGGILVFSGLRMLFGGNESTEEGWFVRTVRKVLPIAEGDYQDRFRARENGKLKLTQLSLALVAIELTDLVFAVDSVPAVLAISTDSFLVISSNIFAILGLRSLYFVLASMMNRFHYLQVALSLLLVLIGLKLFVHDMVYIPHWLSLVVVLGVVCIGIAASLLVKPKRMQGE